MPRGLTELLLGRPPLALGARGAGACRGRTILVTGAGGFIGSALCRRLGRLGAGRLVLLEQAEGHLHRVVDRLGPTAGERLRAVLGDAGDERLLDEVLEAERPHLVFHAAGCKHVPLLEGQPLPAVRHNVLATRAVTRAAARWGVSTLVLLSTDKAVEPSGVMGASKRLAEMLILTAGPSATRFAALRLGNVLGSSGSVLPRLRRQLRRGRPLTVTHPEASRYFLSCSEAVTLLLEAVGAARARDLLVPDPGPPVRILDLADRLRTAAASSVPIVFSGLRPGDKLSEALWSRTESVEPTGRPRLYRVRGPLPRPAEVDAAVEALEEMLARRDAGAVVAKLREATLAERPGVDTSGVVSGGAAPQ